MTTVWLARHGEVHNPRNVLYGRLPRMRLTAVGRREAEAIATFLARRPLAAVYSSPLLRARSTAEIIRRPHRDLPRVRIDSDLIEIRTGWEGEALDALERINWDFYANPRHAEDESLQAIHDRMHRWLARVLRRHAGGHVVGVSHGDPVLVLTGSLQGVPLTPERIFPRPYIHTGALYRLRFDADGRCREVTLLPRDLRQSAGLDEEEAA